MLRQPDSIRMLVVQRTVDHVVLQVLVGHRGERRNVLRLLFAVDLAEEELTISTSPNTNRPVGETYNDSIGI